MSKDPNPGSGSPTPAGQPINYATASTPKGPAAYTGAAPDQDSKTMGMLAHLLGIPLGFIGPLIIWLVKKETSPFVNDQGKEALNWQISAGIAIAALVAVNLVIGLVLGMAKLGIVVLVISCVFYLIILAIAVCNLIFSIMGALSANKGNAYRYPFALRLIK